MPSRFRVEIISGWAAFEPRWRRLDLGAPSPFQTPGFLRTWYGAFTRLPQVEPLLVAVSDLASGEDLALLPLIRHRQGWLTAITFADLWVVDSTAPLLAPGCPADAQSAMEMWAEIRQALPPADLIQFAKMLPEINGKPNPLGLLPGIRLSPFTRHVLRFDVPWEQHLRVFDKHSRKELGRSRRMFEAAGDGRFWMADTLVQSRTILAAIGAFQRRRFENAGIRHVFDGEAHTQFYRALAETAASILPLDRTALLSALELNGEIVAGMLSITDGKAVTLLRIGNRGGELARIGLGRLVIERTINALSMRGIRTFDFSIGEGTVKKLFRAAPEPLVELRQALTWRGQAAVTAEQARSTLSQSPLGGVIKARLRSARASKEQGAA